MRIITGNRGSGLSTSLVLESAQFNIPILTTSTGSCEHLKDLAEQMGLSIPEPINLNQISLNLKYYLETNDRLLIDNASFVLKELLKEKGFNGHIVAAGLTFDRIEV